MISDELAALRGLLVLVGGVWNMEHGGTWGLDLVQPHPIIKSYLFLQLIYTYDLLFYTVDMKPVKKTYLLPQKLINQVKKIFHAKTETEAIIRAMQELTLQNDLLKWHQKNQGKLSIKNLYA